MKNRNTALPAIARAVLALSVVIAGAAGITPAYARSLAEIKQSGEIRICIVPIDISFVTVEPPDCRDDCKAFGGSMYELSLAFAQTLGDGVKPRFLRVDWNEQFHNEEGKVDREAAYTPQLLASGRCDFYPSHLAKHQWRLNKLDFVTLFPHRWLVVTHKDNKAAFEAVADLGGNVAAVVENTSLHVWVQQQNKTILASNPIQIEFMPATDTVMDAVDAGQVDFSLLPADSALWHTRHRAKNSVVVFAAGSIYEVGWGFRKGDKELQNAARQFIDKQTTAADSALNRIWKSYYGLSMPKFIRLVSKIR